MKTKEKVNEFSKKKNTKAKDSQSYEDILMQMIKEELNEAK